MNRNSKLARKMLKARVMPIGRHARAGGGAGCWAGEDVAEYGAGMVAARAGVGARHMARLVLPSRCRDWRDTCN